MLDTVKNELKTQRLKQISSALYDARINLKDIKMFPSFTPATVFTNGATCSLGEYFKPRELIKDNIEKFRIENGKLPNELEKKALAYLSLNLLVTEDFLAESLDFTSTSMTFDASKTKTLRDGRFYPMNRHLPKEKFEQKRFASFIVDGYGEEIKQKFSNDLYESMISFIPQNQGPYSVQDFQLHHIKQLRWQNLFPEENFYQFNNYILIANLWHALIDRYNWQQVSLLSYKIKQTTHNSMFLSYAIPKINRNSMGMASMFICGGRDKSITGLSNNSYKMPSMEKTR